MTDRSGKFSSEYLSYRFLAVPRVQVVQRRKEHIKSSHARNEKKPENLTLMGIVTDEVERNPRENTETIPDNRAIDLFIASGVTSSPAETFPSSHSYTLLFRKKVRTIFVVIGMIFGGRSENVRMRARDLFCFGKSKMADFEDKTNFDELCTKCEQMELDVSKIDITSETNVCASFSVMLILCCFALEQHNQF